MRILLLTALLLYGCAESKPISYVSVEECGSEVFALFIAENGEQLMIYPEMNAEANQYLATMPSKNKKTYTAPCNIGT